jgi:hypothetical protein
MSAADHFALSETRRSQRRAIAVAIVVLLFALVNINARRGEGRARPAVSGDPVAGLPEATLEASGRGVETSATIRGITSLALDGAPSISITGHLPGDPADATRTFYAARRPLTLRGSGISLDVTTLVRPNEVRIEGFSGSRENATVSGRVTLVATEITSRRAGAEKPEIHRGSITFVAGGTAMLETGAPADPPGARWTDAPTTIRFADDLRSITDWAGKGTVRVGGRSYSHQFGAFAARQLQATVTREPGVVKVSGRGRVEQVYLDGEPQLRTTATCDLVQIRERTSAGRELELTWAPRNLGDSDMVMTRIVPIGLAAGWLSLGLEGKLHEFGGEMRPYRRGDTAGFRSGLPISSVLPPGSADRRDIGIGVPEGIASGTYDASVRIEGNFDSVVVPFEVIVVPADELHRN